MILKSVVLEGFEHEKLIYLDESLICRESALQSENLKELPWVSVVTSTIRPLRFPVVLFLYILLTTEHQPIEVGPTRSGKMVERYS